MFTVCGDILLLINVLSSGEGNIKFYVFTNPGNHGLLKVLKNKY